jgi:drug/metabolite transporter (DMT)-like permease
VLAFSTSGALAKLCSAPAITIAFWVRLASLLSLVVALWMQNRERTLPLLAGSWRLGLLGGVLFGAHTLTYFWALKLTSVAVVALLGALNPAVVGLVGFLFLGERLTLAQTSWTAVAIAGAGALVVARDAAGATPLVGNLVATVTTILYCGYFLISRHARRGVGTLEYLTAATAANLAVSAVVMVAIPGAVSRRAVA